MFAKHCSFLLTCVALARVGAVTVYNPAGAVQSGNATVSSSTTSAAPTSTYFPAAFNTVTLSAPPVPTPAPPTQFSVSPPNSAQDVSGLSIQQSGSFLGFSIEMSVVDQVVGRNASLLQVPFLNLMSIVAERSGSVHIRVGGNTQETAVIVDSLPDNEMIGKDKDDVSNPTETPTLYITPELFYMIANVTALVSTKWYFGIPFNDTTHPRLEIAELAEQILGNNVIGFQMGNEPDLYVSHQHRNSSYDPDAYADEFGTMIQDIIADPNIPVNNNLIGPSVSGTWTPEMVWNTGYITRFSANLGALAVEHYPDNNCAVAFPDAGFGDPIDPQTIFPSYLTHAAATSIVGPYLNSTGIAQGAGKPFLMFETNTASCGGFPGVSDSFGAALWALDYGLQMAYTNFSGALLHVGGVDDTYNPFNPPQTNESAVLKWTVTPIFYSTVVVAEALGKSGGAQVFDLDLNSGNAYTPGYAIYDGGSLARVALINFVTNPEGSTAYTYTANISIAGGSVPSQVSVKYLVAPSVAEKWNITWAGQTLGGQFESDGRFQGNEDIQTVQCDTTNNVCAIEVPAPGAALVFMNSDALSDSEPTTTVTYSTTVFTAKTQSIETIIPSSVLATAQGQNGANREQLGSTSKETNGASRSAGLFPSLATLFMALAGGLTLMAGLHR